MGLVLLRLLLSCKTSWRTPSGVGARSKKGFAKQLSTHYTSGFARCDAALPTITIISRPFRHVLVMVGQYEDARFLKMDACAKEEAQLKKAKESACKVVAQLPRSARTGRPTLPSARGWRATTRARRRRPWLRRGAKCTAATSDYDSKVTSCSALKSTWTSQKSTCDEQQDVMDAAPCEVFWRPKRRFARSMLRAMSRPLHPTIWM